MADKSIKVPGNVDGAWYVDTTCTPCRTCMEVAGVEALLQWNADETQVFFHTQPADAAQTAIAEEAMAVCPTAAIGNDGE